MRDRPALAATSRAQDVAEAVGHLALAETSLARHAEVPLVTAALHHLAAARRSLADVPTRGRRTAAKASDASPPVLSDRLELPAQPTSSRTAREFCSTRLEGWSVPTRIVRSATDVASELVANATRYASSAVVLVLDLTPGQLMIRVWDDATGTPYPLPYRIGVSERGLGLRLVKQLSTDWGWEAAPGGKWVWARLVYRVGATTPRAPA